MIDSIFAVLKGDVVQSGKLKTQGLAAVQFALKSPPLISISFTRPRLSGNWGLPGGAVGRWLSCVPTCPCASACRFGF